MKNWNSSIPFPLDNYIVRILPDATFGPSSKGKPMITLNYEVVSPESVKIAGEDYNVAGVKTRPTYNVTKSVDEDGNVDVEKTDKIKQMLDDMCTKMGVPLITDPENPDINAFKGKYVWALVGNESVERRKAPTAEQLARGERQGDIIKNPVTGEPLVNNYPKIQQFFGVPTDDVIRQLQSK